MDYWLGDESLFPVPMIEKSTEKIWHASHAVFLLGSLLMGSPKVEFQFQMLLLIPILFLAALITRVS